MKRAVYAGSFDPITNGHLWMIEQGARLFDELIVALGVNPDKKYTFTLEERIETLRSSTDHLPQVRIDSFEGQFVVHYAFSVGANYILRGIRTPGDYEFERGIRLINGDLRPEIVTVFLIPPREMSEVSSSLVKGLIGPHGWEAIIQQYVPEAAYRLITSRYHRSGAGPWPDEERT